MSLQPVDSILWDGLRAGDEQAVFDLYSKLYFDLVNYGISICGEVELAKDMVNQVFLELWDKRERLVPVENVKSYLFTYLRRKIIDQIKLKQRAKGAAAENIRLDGDIELSYEQYIVQVQTDEEIKAKLQQALAHLTPRQRELIQLKFFEGLSYEDIAEKTSQHIKTSYNMIYEALKILREALLQ